MTFPEDHTTDSKIQSISDRLSAAVVKNDTYVNSQIKLEGLQLGLPYVLAKIIQKLIFINRGIDEFHKILDQYNSAQGLNITYKDFITRDWVLESGSQILIPEVLRHIVWKLGYDEQKGDKVDISQDTLHYVNIIQLYYQTYFENAVLTITKKDIILILKSFSGNISIDVLLEKEILRRTEDKYIYVWTYHNEYLRHLSNEITALLWSDYGGENAEITNFMEFFKRMLGAGIWPDDFGTYLPVASSKKLITLASQYVSEEKDLERSDNEFSKMWLNSNDDYRYGIDTIPLVYFSYEDHYRFIESVEAAQQRYPSRFDYPHSRKYVLLLIRLLVGSEVIGQKRFDSILKILGSFQSPYILWNVYKEAKRLYPALIPNFIKDTDLAPLAFRMIDKIEVKGNYYADTYDKFLDMRENVDRLWNEMFDTFLDLIARRVGEVKSTGMALAKILKDLAGNVFKTSGTTLHATIDHAIYRRRYESVLRKLKEAYFSSSPYSFENKDMDNSRVILHFLPEIIDYIGIGLTTSKSYRWHHIRLDIADLDLGIEILNLLNSGIQESVVDNSGSDLLSIQGNNLAKILYNNLVEYYSITDVEIFSFVGEKEGLQKASRSTTEFGYEIVDWAQLYLCFEQAKLFDKFDADVIGSIEFDKDQDKYNEQNREQVIKLSYYIKSLLLAFQQLNNKKEVYEIKALPVTSTNRKLGNLVLKYAYHYSIDDIAKGRIDIFNERYSAFGYDKYHQHLANLLYSSIPYFNINDQEKFVREYFSYNTDISRLLTAINTIESNELQDIVSQRVDQLDIEHYIESKFMITDLEYALVEAVNSEKYFTLAESFLRRVERHYNNRKAKTEQSENFIFEISLLLAFKSKNFERLNEIEIPKPQYRINGADEHNKRLKSYYIALFHIYVDKNYDHAIGSLRILMINEPKNVRFAFHLYRAQTLKAMEL